MRLKKQPVILLSLEEQQRLTSYFNLLITIDKRLKASRSKEKRSQSRSRSSTKKSARNPYDEVRSSSELFYCLKIYFINTMNFLTNTRHVIWQSLRTNTRHAHDLVLCL